MRNAGDHVQCTRRMMRALESFLSRSTRSLGDTWLTGKLPIFNHTSLASTCRVRSLSAIECMWSRVSKPVPPIVGLKDSPPSV